MIDTAVIGRNGATVQAVINRINALLGKTIDSPREDIIGQVDVLDVRSVQVIQEGPESYYGVAVVVLAVRRENLNVERAFFDTVPQEAEEIL